MAHIRRARAKLLSLDRFALYNIIAIIVGGLIAASLMRPWLDAGPIRLTTYIVFFLSSVLLAQRYLSIIRDSEDGLASIFLIAATLWWISFAITSICIEYLILARVYGFWPHITENTQERIAYFFISGAAIGVGFKAVTFRLVPKQMLMGRRVRAWPLTVARRRRAVTLETLEVAEQEQDERELSQNIREEQQDKRQHELEEREEGLHSDE